MSNIHRDDQARGLDDEEIWLGGKPPCRPPRWLTEGMAVPEPNPYHVKDDHDRSPQF